MLFAANLEVLHTIIKELFGIFMYPEKIQLRRKNILARSALEIYPKYVNKHGVK